MTRRGKSSGALLFWTTIADSVFNVKRAAYKNSLEIIRYLDYDNALEHGLTPNALMPETE